MFDIVAYNRGTKYLNANKPLKAISFYKRAGSFKERHVNEGNCWRLLGNLDKAFSCYHLSNSNSIPYSNGSYSSDYPLALNNMGMLAYGSGDYDTATLLYKQALATDPLYYEALWNLSHSMLRAGFNGADIDFNVAWRLYEYRFKRAKPVGLSNSLPMWDMVSSGECIVVLAEQGLGDKIMFGRYIHLLRGYFKRVVVQCHPSLDCIFDDFEICRDTEGFGSDAVAIPICSLALKFYKDKPRGDWLLGKFTGKKLDGKNVGVVWSGSTTHSNDSNRSCPSKYFSRFASLGTLWSLNPAANAVTFARKANGSSWSDTATLCLGLDYVITVDTSIVHLCGSLGVRCILIQPIFEKDFRWGDGDSTEWYSSVEMVSGRNWEESILKVLECIK